MVSKQLTVGGLVKSSITLRADALTGVPFQPIPDIPLRGRTGELLRTLQGYSGIKLITVLDQAGLIAAEHNDLKKTVIVATATDGYKAVFSWNELYNTAIGDGVFVLAAKTGQPLADEEGRFALISAQDIKTGARHVRWLTDIQVLKIA